MLLLVPAVGKDGAVQKISTLLSKYPRWCALIAGALSAAGFEPFGLWPVTLLCFALLIHLLNHASGARRAAMIGWLFGIGHFSVGNNWIAVAFTFQAAMPIWLGYFAVILLAMYLAVYPALAASGAWWINSRIKQAAKPGAILPLILAFAGCWTISPKMKPSASAGPSNRPKRAPGPCAPDPCEGEGSVNSDASDMRILRRDSVRLPSTRCQVWKRYAGRLPPGDPSLTLFASVGVAGDQGVGLAKAFARHDDPVAGKLRAQEGQGQRAPGPAPGAVRPLEFG